MIRTDAVVYKPALISVQSSGRLLSGGARSLPQQLPGQSGWSGKGSLEGGFAV